MTGRGVSGPRVVIAPPVPALLGRYASLQDPVGPLRAACAGAVGWLDEPVRVLADDGQGHAVAESLLGRPADAAGGNLLVMANGSACRTEKAPGHLDPRAAGFDARLGALLAAGDLAGLAALDRGLGRDLLAAGLESLAGLQALGLQVASATIDYDDDPFGVQYWVVRWQCES